MTPNHDADIRILKWILALRDKGKSINFADGSKAIGEFFNETFRGVGCLTSSKPFDFVADPVHDSDPGIFDRIPTTVK